MKQYELGDDPVFDGRRPGRAGGVFIYTYRGVYGHDTISVVTERMFNKKIYILFAAMAALALIGVTR